MSIEIQGQTCDVVTWQELGDDGITQIHEIEKQTWAPWLAASYESLAGRAKVNHAGQLAIVGAGGDVWASLSTNKIDWSGDVGSLPTWDDVAGDPTDYAQTYVPDGNSVVLMSMNVSPDKQGLHLPSELISQLVLSSMADPSVEQVIGSFRPSEFFKSLYVAPNLSFEDYISSDNPHGKGLADKWLRALTLLGMKPLAVDHEAMSVPVTAEEFGAYKAASALHGLPWKTITINGQEVWWCGETGVFYKDDEGYVYKESNLWGMLWSKGMTK